MYLDSCCLLLNNTLFVSFCLFQAYFHWFCSCILYASLVGSFDSLGSIVVDNYLSISLKKLVCTFYTVASLQKDNTVVTGTHATIVWRLQCRLYRKVLQSWRVFSNFANEKLKCGNKYCKCWQKKTSGRSRMLLVLVVVLVPVLPERERERERSTSQRNLILHVIFMRLNIWCIIDAPWQPATKKEILRPNLRPIRYYLVLLRPRKK